MDSFECKRTRQGSTDSNKQFRTALCTQTLSKTLREGFCPLIQCIVILHMHGLKVWRMLFCVWETYDGQHIPVRYMACALARPLSCALYMSTLRASTRHSFDHVAPRTSLRRLYACVASRMHVCVMHMCVMHGCDVWVCYAMRDMHVCGIHVCGICEAPSMHVCGMHECETRGTKHACAWYACV